MGGLPNMLFVIDTNKESIAIAEAQKLGIPVTAILDSNSNPDGITHPIPGQLTTRPARWRSIATSSPAPSSTACRKARWRPVSTSARPKPRSDDVPAAAPAEEAAAPA